MTHDHELPDQDRVSTLIEECRRERIVCEQLRDRWTRFQIQAFEAGNGATVSTMPAPVARPDDAPKP